MKETTENENQEMEQDFVLWGEREKKEKITAVLNEVMVNKLESIAFDIKYYINTNAGIAQSLDEESINAFKFMDDEEINELIEIRKRTKQLAYKLKNKLNSK